MVRLVMSMYEISNNFLEKIMSDNWMGQRNKVAILGGIMINCEGEGTDVFLPLKFTLKTKDGIIDISDCFQE